MDQLNNLSNLASVDITRTSRWNFNVQLILMDFLMSISITNWWQRSMAATIQSMMLTQSISKARSCRSQPALVIRVVTMSMQRYRKQSLLMFPINVVETSSPLEQSSSASASAILSVTPMVRCHFQTWSWRKNLDFRKDIKLVKMLLKELWWSKNHGGTNNSRETIT